MELAPCVKLATMAALWACDNHCNDENKLNMSRVWVICKWSVCSCCYYQVQHEWTEAFDYYVLKSKCACMWGQTGHGVCWPHWSTSWGRSGLLHPGPAELLLYLPLQHIHPDHWQTGWRGLWAHTHTHTHTQKRVQLYHRKAGLLHAATVRTIEATLWITSYNVLMD